MTKLMNYVNILDPDDKWETSDDMHTKHIDGVEFLWVRKPGTHRYFWIRKDSLKKFTPSPFL
jgi:hypothetical protein